MELPGPLGAEAIATAQRTSRTDEVVRRTADLIERWTTEGASDGFTLQPTTLPGSLEDFTDYAARAPRGLSGP